MPLKNVVMLFFLEHCAKSNDDRPLLCGRNKHGKCQGGSSIEGAHVQPHVQQSIVQMGGNMPSEGVVEVEKPSSSFFLRGSAKILRKSKNSDLFKQHTLSSLS